MDCREWFYGYWSLELVALVTILPLVSFVR